MCVCVCVHARVHAHACIYVCAHVCVDVCRGDVGYQVTWCLHSFPKLHLGRTGNVTGLVLFPALFITY